ncbi:MAG: AsmA family protein [Gammaproteobacteria bacterium]|nr:AsmA family protein [Gammaproteobacteria bacterium]MBU1628579.1 AsmA family protein [Gammaproteobacteria bacterium]MBU1926948.1 AsmA family protein [Gammaproteobacteria bacterium]MBU2545705.1 AsmA family protein [Gammaproteobacteria bacterium]
MRKVFWILGVILLIGAILFALLFYFSRPNYLKPLIISKVQKATGRELVIGGNLHWTIFPTLGIEVDQITLKNTPAFGSTPFATMQNATIGVKLLPLFHRKVETSRILIQGLSLHLMKDKNGQTNWEDLIKPKTEDTSSSASTTPSEPTPKTQSNFQLDIPEVAIKDASLSWEDQSTGKQVQLHHIDIQSKNIGTKRAFPLQVVLHVESKQPALSGKVQLDSQVMLHQTDQQLELRDFKVVTEMKGKALPKENLQATLAAPSIVLGQNHLQSQTFTLDLNDTHCQGKVNLSDLQTGSGSFALNVDTLNLDQWMQKQAKKTKGSKATQASGKTKSSNMQLPSFLKTLQLNGQINIQRLIVNRLHLQKIKVGIQAKQGIITFSPLSSQLYRGTFRGKLVLNAQGKTLRISKQGQVNQISFQPLFTDLNGYKNLLGTGTMSFSLTTSGLNQTALLRQLNGKISFNVKDGALKGLDIAYLIHAARAIIKKQLPPVNSGGNQSNFGTLTGTANIQQGVLSCNDLRLVSKAYVVTGKGTVNLVNKRVDYRLEVDPKDPSIKFTIPISVTGTYDKPSGSLDKAELLKRLLVAAPTELIKKQIKQTLPLGIGNHIDTIKGLLS